MSRQERTTKKEAVELLTSRCPNTSFGEFERSECTYTAWRASYTIQLDALTAYFCVFDDF